MQAEMLESPLNRAAQFLLSHQTLDVFSPYATRTMDMMLLERQKFSMNLEQSSAAGFLNHSDEMININTFPLFVVDDPSCESPPSIMNGNGQANNCISANNVPGSGSGWPDMDNYVKFANQYEQQSIDNSYEPQPVYAGGPALRTERKTTTPEVTLSRTISCPAAVIQRNLSSLSDTRTPSPPLSGDSLKKRKGYGKEVPSPAPTYRKMEPMRKTIKGEVVELDENIDNGRDAGKSSGNGDKEKPKSVLDIPKPDYIHVRARRGQATDSHSLAERVRREKISERMRLLQDLVPGCNKITGKAGMLDEIINYVQSLQRQVEFLSMKLAAVNRRSEGTAENGFLDKGMFTPCHPSVPNVGLSPEITPSAFHHLNLMRSTAGPTTQHAAAGSCSMELPIHINNNHDTNPNGNLPINHNHNNNNNIPSGMTLRRTTSAPVAVTDDFIQSCFQDNGLPLITPAWDFDLSNFYTMDFPRAKQSPLSSDTFTGNMETHNLKMELMQ